MMDQPDVPVCVDCFAPLGTDRVIHDRGEPWHHACRKAYVAQRAERRAIRLTGRHLHIGRVLVEIQREKPKEAAA